MQVVDAVTSPSEGGPQQAEAARLLRVDPGLVMLQAVGGDQDVRAGPRPVGLQGRGGADRDPCYGPQALRFRAQACLPSSGCHLVGCGPSKEPEGATWTWGKKYDPPVRGASRKAVHARGQQQGLAHGAQGGAEATAATATAPEFVLAARCADTYLETRVLACMPETAAAVGESALTCMLEVSCTATTNPMSFHAAVPVLLLPHLPCLPCQAVHILPFTCIPHWLPAQLEAQLPPGFRVGFGTPLVLELWSKDDTLLGVRSLLLFADDGDDWGLLPQALTAGATIPAASTATAAAGDGAHGAHAASAAASGNGDRDQASIPSDALLGGTGASASTSALTSDGSSTSATVYGAAGAPAAAASDQTRALEEGEGMEEEGAVGKDQQREQQRERARMASSIPPSQLAGLQVMAESRQSLGEELARFTANAERHGQGAMKLAAAFLNNLAAWAQMLEDQRRWEAAELRQAREDTAPHVGSTPAVMQAMEASHQRMQARRKAARGLLCTLLAVAVRHRMREVVSQLMWDTTSRGADGWRAVGPDHPLSTKPARLPALRDLAAKSRCPGMVEEVETWAERLREDDAAWTRGSAWARHLPMHAGLENLRAAAAAAAASPSPAVTPSTELLGVPGVSPRAARARGLSRELSGGVGGHALDLLPPLPQLEHPSLTQEAGLMHQEAIAEPPAPASSRRPSIEARRRPQVRAHVGGIAAAAAAPAGHAAGSGRGSSTRVAATSRRWRAFKDLFSACVWSFQPPQQEAAYAQ